MTTTRPTTCPGWCTRDHGAAERRAREMHAEIEDAFVTPQQAQTDLDEALAYQRDYHSTDDLADGFFLRIATEVTELPSISAVISDDEGLSAEHARSIGRALLATADRLDEIVAAK